MTDQMEHNITADFLIYCISNVISRLDVGGGTIMLHTPMLKT